MRAPQGTEKQRCNLHGACGGKGFAAVRVCALGARRCNLHGACGGKGTDIKDADYIESRSNLHGACGGKVHNMPPIRKGGCVAICTGRVEAKVHFNFIRTIDKPLQSARGVWRQSFG